MSREADYMEAYVKRLSDGPPPGNLINSVPYTAEEIDVIQRFSRVMCDAFRAGMVDIEEGWNSERR